MLSLLLRQRLRLFWNRLARGAGRRRRLIGAFLGAVLGVGFVVVAGLNAGQLVERLARSDQEVAIQALPVLLVGVTVLTLVTSLSSAFHHLFMAGDLELLLAAPVSARTLFWLKILEIWRDSLHVLLFEGAALYAFGQVLHLPLTYYVLAALVGLSLTVAASAVGATLTLALARIRFGESVLVLSRVLAIIAFVPIGVLAVPALGVGRNRLPPLLGLGDVQTLTTSLRSFGPPPAWAPTTWAAHLLLGDEAAGLSLALLITAGVALFVAAQLVFDGFLQAAWERVRFFAPRGRSRPARLRWRFLRGGPVLGLLQKDWRTLLRDPRWRTGAAIGLVALGLPTVAFFAGDPFARSGHVLRFWLGLIPVPYLAYLVGSQQGAATLAYEGRNIALLRAAPIGMGRVLVAKVLGGLVLVLSVTWAATVVLASIHQGDPFEVGAALLAATWLAAGATIAAVAGAALTIDFESDNPVRRVGCVGMIVTSVLSTFFFVANTALLGWWVMRAALSVPRTLLGLVPVVDWGLPSIALVSVGALVLASRLGLRRLAGWEAS